jgi:hypothetical protein
MASTFPTVKLQMAVKLLALPVGHPLPAERFLVLISVRRRGNLRPINSNDLIRNQAHSFPACIIVLQPTALPCVITIRGN